MKKTRIVVILFFAVIIAVVVFYYRLGVGFGRATVETVETIEEVRADFKKKNINPIDTIVTQTDKVLDSIKSNKQKDSLN